MPYELFEYTNQNQTNEHELSIYYTSHPIKESFNILASGLVFENDIHPLHSEVTWLKGFPQLFPSHDQCSLGFDIFSATFYMAARYEEYLPFKPDRFGRFPEVESLSGKFDFTHLPVIHVWAYHFQQKLNKFFGHFKVTKRIPSATFTYDIDVAYAYRGRDFPTHVLSLGKDLLTGQIDNIKQKLFNRFGLKNDPSDTYKSLESNPLRKIYFFLLAEKRTQFDRNISPDSSVLRDLILGLKEKTFELGIHPSYHSSEQRELIFKEKQTLQSIVNHDVTKSRQHFLRFSLPHTFRELIQAGITDDYSMQYAEMPGFRAGLCLPFPFFDLITNTETKLMLHPGCIMETTFRDDLHVPARQSFEWYLSQWEQVKKVGGEFICIWHNDTLWDNLPDDNPLAFKQVHDKLIKIIQDDLKSMNA